VDADRLQFRHGPSSKGLLRLLLESGIGTRCITFRNARCSIIASCLLPGGVRPKGTGRSPLGQARAQQAKAARFAERQRTRAAEAAAAEAKAEQAKAALRAKQETKRTKRGGVVAAGISWLGESSGEQSATEHAVSQDDGEKGFAQSDYGCVLLRLRLPILALCVALQLGSRLWLLHAGVPGPRLHHGASLFA
jgi:hypothetical protein